MVLYARVASLYLSLSSPSRLEAIAIWLDAIAIKNKEERSSKREVVPKWHITHPL